MKYKLISIFEHQLFLDFGNVTVAHISDVFEAWTLQLVNLRVKWTNIPNLVLHTRMGHMI